jgi:nitric oxide reductase large subunit
VKSHEKDELADLRGLTIVWILLVVWLAWGYLIQPQPAGPYADAVATAFATALAVIIPAVSAIVALGWIAALRRRRDRTGR